jgi:hypothetical protein
MIHFLLVFNFDFVLNPVEVGAKFGPLGNNNLLCSYLKKCTCMLHCVVTSHISDPLLVGSSGSTQLIPKLALENYPERIP